ncbi:MAG: IS21-like element helper ATPase IstB [Cyanobacteria bacterium REEB65]|nr:IS21-like element helper ATPase IstB [Cyanobacteria bacterium REEB65]
MPMTSPELDLALKRLRLSGIQATLQSRALQVSQGNLSFLEGFTSLIQDELDRRRSKWIERQFLLSGLVRPQGLDDFDWSYNMKLPKKAIIELAALKWIEGHEDALLIGSPGTGKSHVARAIGSAAVMAGLRVIYRESHVFFEDLAQASALGSRKKWVAALTEADLLILDDLALRKLPPSAGEELLEVVMNRYGKRSTLITSNRILEDWGKVLGDQTIASAILDRILHRGHLLRFEGRSYRLKQSAERATGKLAKEKSGE